MAAGAVNCVAYLYEQCYDMFIPQASVNILESPEFETPLAFGGNLNGECTRAEMSVKGRRISIVVSSALLLCIGTIFLFSFPP
jgi:hypothetical protein